MPQRNVDDIQFHTLDELRTFTIQAHDGEIGHVSDFLFSPSDWIVRYMVVDTGNWLVGKKVVVSMEWILGIEWETQRVNVSITRNQVKESPPLETMNQLDRSYEERIYHHYQRPHYWIEESKVDEASWESFPASDPPATSSTG